MIGKLDRRVTFIKHIYFEDSFGGEETYTTRIRDQLAALGTTLTAGVTLEPVSTTSFGPFYRCAPNPVSGSITFDDYMQATPLSMVYISAWARSDTASKQISVSVNWLTSAGAYISTANDLDTLGDADTWAKYQLGPLTPPSNAYGYGLVFKGLTDNVATVDIGPIYAGPLFEVWAQYQPPVTITRGSQEGRVSAQEQAFLTGAFVVRHSSEIAALNPLAYHIQYDGANWDIESITEIERGKYWRIRAQRNYS